MVLESELLKSLSPLSLLRSKSRLVSDSLELEEDDSAVVAEYGSIVKPISAINTKFETFKVEFLLDVRSEPCLGDAFWFWSSHVKYCPIICGTFSSLPPHHRLGEHPPAASTAGPEASDAQTLHMT